MDRMLDVSKLVKALEDKKGSDSWASIADATGMSRSTFSRMRGGSPPDLDGFLRLIHWLEDGDVRKFIREG